MTKSDNFEPINHADNVAIDQNNHFKVTISRVEKSTKSNVICVQNWSEKQDAWAAPLHTHIKPSRLCEMSSPPEFGPNEHREDPPHFIKLKVRVTNFGKNIFHQIPSIF